jgi:acyl-CoA thioesterase I
MAALTLKKFEVLSSQRSKLSPRKTARRHLRSIVFAVLLFSGFGAPPVNAETVRYVAIGDSYTICEGVAEKDCWPTLLTRHLVDAGIEIELITNPSRTGWKVEDAIRDELPVFEKSRPTFATLLIGVNDWVHGSGKNKFTSGLRTLLDRMQKELPRPRRLLIVTIPDFSCAPRGESYSYGRNIAKGIARYNAIIQKEAKKRSLAVVNIFPLSQTFCDQREMFVEDGIHPSAKQYVLWEQLIFPVAHKILRQ